MLILLSNFNVLTSFSTGRNFSSSQSTLLLLWINTLPSH
jgi:hypothetical protein